MSQTSENNTLRQGADVTRFNPSASPAGKRDWIFGLVLVVAIIIAYQPAWNGLPIWDDNAHITHPALRSLHGLVRIWTQPGASQQYYPFVHGVFWVEHRLWGDATLGYHLVNILLHAFSALLLARILRQLEVPGAWLAATIFALHPVQVESVAWISELKNTLSGAFYLSSTLAYLEFDRKRGPKPYLAALGLFVLGLLSKTVIATLPATLLLVFWWKRGRLSWRQDVQPLIPFFLAGITAGLFTAWMERTSIGAQGREFDFTFIERFLIAGRAIWFYLGKLFWPAELTFIYPRWHVSQAVWWQYLFPAAGLLLLLALWKLRQRCSGPLVALLYFAGTLFPALGFLNVYPFRFSFVADHFQYLAAIGPITLASAGIVWLAVFFKLRSPWLELILWVGLLLALGTLSWRQARIYRSIEALWTDTLQKNPNCGMAHNHLGITLFGTGRVDEAAAHFQKAIEIDSNDDMAHNNLGKVFLQTGRAVEAIAQFQKAIEIHSDSLEAHYNLGNALLQVGRVDEAIAHFQKAIEINPNDAEAHNNLGNVFLQMGRADEAMAHYQRAVEINPNSVEAHYNLGNALFQKGRVDEAMARYQRAVEIAPNDAEAHSNLGNALLQMGRVDEAMSHYQRAIEIDPNHAEVHNNLGTALRQVGRVDEAIIHYQKAVEINPNFAQACYNLSLVLRQAGRVDEAVKTAQRALELATDQNNKMLADMIREGIGAY
jgi:tetratricopeptide (TPR) repeat protein